MALESREGTRASRRVEEVLELRRPWGFSPEARRGSQGASRAAPGKSGLHARGEGERVLARAEGLLFLHGLESNPACSLQTPQNPHRKHASSQHLPGIRDPATSQHTQQS